MIASAKQLELPVKATESANFFARMKILYTHSTYFLTLWRNCSNLYTFLEKSSLFLVLGTLNYRQNYPKLNIFVTQAFWWSISTHRKWLNMMHEQSWFDYQNIVSYPMFMMRSPSWCETKWAEIVLALIILVLVSTI